MGLMPLEVKMETVPQWMTGPRRQTCLDLAACRIGRQAGFGASAMVVATSVLRGGVLAPCFACAPRGTCGVPVAVVLLDWADATMSISTCRAGQSMLLSTNAHSCTFRLAVEDSSLIC